jgi:hypothetical protein
MSPNPPSNQDDPQNSDQPPKRDFGEPLPLEELLAMAQIDEFDLIQAQMWWNENEENEDDKL